MSEAALPSLLRWKNSLGLKIKILIFTLFLQLILTHGVLIYDQFKEKRENILQNRALGMIDVVPSFVSNTQIHCDLTKYTLIEYATTLARGTFKRVAQSENPFIRHLGGLDPPTCFRKPCVLEVDDWILAKLRLYRWFQLEENIFGLEELNIVNKKAEELCSPALASDEALTKSRKLLT